MRCAYHSPGKLELEYRPKTVSSGTTSCAVVDPEAISRRKPQGSGNSLSKTAVIQAPHQCGHVFQPGEDIYHCQDCSAHEGVVLCSRCFHGSACVNHEWRMGEFPRRESKLGGGGSTEDTFTTVVDGLGIRQAAFNASTSPSREGQDLGLGIGPDSGAFLEQSAHEDSDTAMGGNVITCGCGDPGLFRRAFDCNYHLPQEFRPVSHLIHCNYLFQRQEVMYQCRTCYRVVGKTGEEEDIWICGRCFDPEQHEGHETEQAENHWNEGLYCRCGDSSILRDHGGSEAGSIAAEMEPENDMVSMSAALTATAMKRCSDDHNRQTVLCTTKIKEGASYYQCKVLRSIATVGLDVKMQ